MISIIGVVCFAVLASAAPQQSQQQQPTQPPIPILRAEINNQGDGTYNYAYETANQIQAQEQGALKSEQDGIAVQGSYSYVDLEGNQISVQYTADENGFLPQGAHIPTPPPIPQEIQEALARNAAEEASLSAQELEAINTGRYLGN